jgi:hypothetical protein
MGKKTEEMAKRKILAEKILEIISQPPSTDLHLVEQQFSALAEDHELSLIKSILLVLMKEREHEEEHYMQAEFESLRVEQEREMARRESKAKTERDAALQELVDVVEELKQKLKEPSSEKTL